MVDLGTLNGLTAVAKPALLPNINVEKIKEIIYGFPGVRASSFREIILFFCCLLFLFFGCFGLDVMAFLWNTPSRLELGDMFNMFY